MLNSRGRWALVSAALLCVTALLPEAAYADHDRSGGDWEPDVVQVSVVLTYRHFNPWVCSNPPEYYDFSLGVDVADNCTWDPLGSAPPNGIFETDCYRNIPDGTVITDVPVGQALGDLVDGDCGHSPYANGQWTFAGSSHALHRNVTVSTRSAHYCAVLGVTGGEYDANGHPVGHSGGVCGAWTPDPNQAPVVSISGVAVVEGESAVLPIVAGSGFGGGSG